MRALRARIESLAHACWTTTPRQNCWRGLTAASRLRGIRRQHHNRVWEIHAGAVVLVTGGAGFLSGLLGARRNTGHGYLMAAEPGAELSSMELTAGFSIAAARSNMTRISSAVRQVRLVHSAARACARASNRNRAAGCRSGSLAWPKSFWRSGPGA